MKNILLLIIINLLIPFSSLSNDSKEFKKYIKKYDIADEAKKVEPNNPLEFWNSTINNNESLIKFFEDIKRNKGAEKEAIEQMLFLPRFYPENDNFVAENLQGLCDTILMDMGLSLYGCSLHIIYSEEINAYCVLKEKGFAICLTTELINQPGINYNIIMGYVAHEFAHGIFMHHIRSFYAEAKERRKNKLLGSIAAGLNAVAAGIETYNAAAYGIPKSGIDYEARTANIRNKIDVETLKYSFRYSREQEIEADLVAFRFLQNLGVENEYITGLEILGTQYDALYSDYSDHPTTLSRIKFLQFVQEHPKLGNKENAKLKKRRLYQADEW